MTECESAKILGGKFYKLDGFVKADIAELLGKEGRYWQTVAVEFFKHFDFTNKTLDSALRILFERIGKIDETKNKKLLLRRFGLRYLQYDKTFISDIVLSKLTFTLIALNDNLHGSNKQISCDEFTKCVVAGLYDGEDFAPDVLKKLYESIRKESLYSKCGGCHETAERVSEVRKASQTNDLCSVSNQDLSDSASSYQNVYFDIDDPVKYLKSKLKFELGIKFYNCKSSACMSTNYDYYNVDCIEFAIESNLDQANTGEVLEMSQIDYSYFRSNETNFFNEAIALRNLTPDMIEEYKTQEVIANLELISSYDFLSYCDMDIDGIIDEYLTDLSDTSYENDNQAM
ncbi:hypothetical protein B4U79_17139, partial [Dinothrombium tinctorium]